MPGTAALEKYSKTCVHWGEMVELQLHPTSLWKETPTPQERSLQKWAVEGGGATQTPMGLLIEFGIMGSPTSLFQCPDMFFAMIL